MKKQKQRFQGRIWSVILRYYQSRLLVRKLHFYQKSVNKEDREVNSNDFLATCFRSEQKAEKYQLIKDLAKETTQYIDAIIIVPSEGYKDLYEQEFAKIKITPDGKKVYTISGIIFGNMGVLLGIIFSIIGVIAGIFITYYNHDIVQSIIHIFHK